jgi:hypothetical protein
MIMPTIRKPINFLRRVRAELKATPTRAMPAIGSHMA